MRIKHRGASAVEFAIVLPLLLLMLDGVTELSVLMYDKVILTNAAREAARAGMVIKNPKLSDADIVLVAQNYASAYLVSFGAARAVTVQVTQTPDPVFQTPLTVKVSYTFSSLMVSGLLSAIDLPVVLSSSAMRMNE